MEQKKTSRLNLLLCDADDRQPTLTTGMAGETAKRKETADRVLPFGLWGDDEPPDELPAQRWGIIAPQGPDGDRLIALMKDLIALRAEQQGDPVKILRVAPNLGNVEADAWRRQLFSPTGDMEADMPRYQLILGNLDQVGMATQLTQSADSFVGRLAFDSDDGYASYAAKVLRFEKKTPTVGQGNARFFTVHDDTPSTTDGYEKLVKPVYALAQERQKSGRFAARDIQNIGKTEDPSPDEFLQAAASQDPTVMFSMSHGAGMPKGAGWKSPDDQRQRQGAMSFGRQGGLLTGADIANKTFLPGGVWFMFACFGAGTPQTSAYRHWLEKMRDAGEDVGNIGEVLRSLPMNGAPFISALPQAALKNQNGPLAFMGHIDLAWNYSYEDLDGAGAPYPRPGRFLGVMRSLLDGHRMGVAFRELMRFFGQVNTALTSRLDQVVDGKLIPPTAAEEAARGHLWMLRQDLAGYMLLGDPAVRLPIDPSLAAVNKAAQGTDLTALFGFAPQASTGTSPSTLRTDLLEKLLAQIIFGQKTAPQIAKDAGVEVNELMQLAKAYKQGGRQAIKRG